MQGSIDVLTYYIKILQVHQRFLAVVSSIIDTMHFLGMTFYPYTRVPYSNITPQHANNYVRRKRKLDNVLL